MKDEGLPQRHVCRGIVFEVNAGELEAEGFLNKIEEFLSGHFVGQTFGADVGNTIASFIRKSWLWGISQISPHAVR